MKVFDTANLSERTMHQLSANEAAWIYNGLDVCVTAEVYRELTDQLADEDPRVQQTYAAAMAKQAPILEMSIRGMRINEEARQQTLKELSRDLDALDAKFQRIMEEVWGTRLNWRSPQQLKNLFYGMLGLKERRKRNQAGNFVPTVDRDTLEFFGHFYYAGVLARFILVMRDLHKQISQLKTQIDPDGRMRSSYNIAGTDTGRLSSSTSDFGSGSNLQNVNRKLRYPFVADPGMYMLNIDLEQADGRNVAAICWNLFYESHGPEFAGAYLDACETGDLHTSVCRMTWPELDWPDDPAEQKEFCDALILHGQDSYRQIAKKLGHGTNYYGQPATMAKHTFTPKHIIEEFQRRYFKQFQAIPEWHKWVIEQVQTTGTIYTIYGRRRMFWNRGNDKTTHRAAIAYEPQSMTGEQIDRGILQVWRKFPQVQPLNQVHDSVTFQVPYDELPDIVPAVLETMKVEITLAGGRNFSVPLEAEGGWNWGKYHETKNPHGLRKWRGAEERPRPNVLRRLKDYL